jgi:hypothetical protein
MPPVAIIHDRFQKQIEALRLAAEFTSVSDTSGAPGKWMLLDLGAWDGDPLNIPSIAWAFDRAEINQQYAAMLSDPRNPGSVGSCIALKLQVDWLATLERGFRARHATSVRCSVHAGARRGGHNNPKGIFTTGIQGYIQNIIQGAQ